jgi:hypothetical protein
MKSMHFYLVILLLNAGLQSFAFHIAFDYTYDTNGFFAATERRITLQQAASVFETRIQTVLEPITPANGNQWTLSFTDPGSGLKTVVTNLTLLENTVRIFISAGDLGSNHLGFSDFGYTYAGNSEWLSLFHRRINLTNYNIIGGVISFNSTLDWHFETNFMALGTITTNQYDFYSVAVHELGHLMGITKKGMEGHSTNDAFIGPTVTNLFEGPVPLTSDYHIQPNTRYRGNTLIMVPVISPGNRRIFTEIEFAILSDIGYAVSNVPEVRLSTSQNLQSLTVQWKGGVGPFIVERSDKFLAWTNALSSSTRNRIVQFDASFPNQFFRVIDTGQ